MNKTVNGVAQSDPHWPTPASGQVIGIHGISGGTGANWLPVTFHQQSWGGNGDAVFDFATNTWSLVSNADAYWSGHISMGNGVYANASGSSNGVDSRGMILRNPDNLMSTSQYKFVGQPTSPWNSWCDADHSSWLNSLSNPNAPILSSRYLGGAGCKFAWTGEIIGIATDGSNTVWRFAHNHNGGSVCYYAQGFAQISNDGKWALFSSYWDGTLGSDTAFGCGSRIDTFIVELLPSSGTSSSDSGSGTTTGNGSTSDKPGGTTSGGGNHRWHDIRWHHLRHRHLYAPNNNGDGNTHRAKRNRSHLYGTLVGEQWLVQQRQQRRLVNGFKCQCNSGIHRDRGDLDWLSGPVVRHRASVR